VEGQGRHRLGTCAKAAAVLTSALAISMGLPSITQFQPAPVERSSAPMATDVAAASQPLDEAASSKFEDAPTSLASLEAIANPTPDVAENSSEVAEDHPVAQQQDALPPQQEEPSPDKVVEYLWSVYQRAPLKRDGYGDFTWKDVSAAARMGMSVRDYVIGGIDPDFREQLYHAGLAMDAGGIDWTIMSGFRDDYRQGITSGFKAQPGNSFHGGSIATGGYGHGCAVDIANVGRPPNQSVWHWFDLHGGEFGLQRPLSRIDPAHVQPIGMWRATALRLRADGGQSPNEALTPAADEPVTASNTEAPEQARGDCTKARLRTAGTKDAEAASPPKRPAMTIALPEPHATVGQTHLQSRWNGGHGKWHLAPARTIALPEPHATVGQTPLQSRWTRGRGKWHLAVVAEPSAKPRGSLARKPAPAGSVAHLVEKRQGARRSAKYQG